MSELWVDVTVADALEAEARERMAELARGPANRGYHSARQRRPLMDLIDSLLDQWNEEQGKA